MGRIFSRKYEELELLGQGGQAMVYKVRHVDHKTILALKVLPSYLLENEEMVARFNREALLMTRLHHRNIVRVLGSGHDEELNCHFILMENIQGHTLKQYLRQKGPLPLAEVLEIIRQVATALDYAHSRTPAIIHRDIKPSNIMIEDLTGRAVVLDFGIAKELDDGDRTRTRTGIMIGTWKYSSPEQLRHEPLTGSADIYSLGLVMYEMYTGTQFFSGLDERAVIGKLLYDPKENEPQFSRPTPPAFVSLVTKAIAKARDKRYSRMADFLDDLEACWSVLDATSTQVLVTPEPQGGQPEFGRERIEEIGEQIRKLEQERLLHLVMLVQRQVREVRTQAERIGAPQLVSPLFTEASALEETGAEHLREQRYAAAQEAYTTALNTYIRVNEEAAALVLRRQVEEVQQLVKDTRADAEHYGVDQHAQELYAAAVAAQERAEEFQRQERYEQAQQTYGEAKSLFEDARDLAYHRALKGEAEAARIEAYAAKEDAVREGAQELAAARLQDAVVAVQQADAALDHDEFTQARALYQLASQKYQQTLQQVRLVRRQQALAATAEAAQQWQQQAIELGVEENEPEYQQAAAAQARAALSLSAGDYTQAEEAYKSAQQLFEELTHSAERKHQQHALRAQTGAQQAKAEAEQAGAQQWATENYQAALVTYAHAEQSFAQGGHAQAAQEYATAQQAFVSARDLAIQNTLRESAKAVREQMLTVRTKAEQAHAMTWARVVWQRAVTTEQKAISAFQHGDYEQARSSFLAGQEQYADAAQQAEVERQRQRHAATAADEAAGDAKQRAIVAKVPDTHAIYQQAVAAQSQAEAHVYAEEYEAAVQVYGNARALYEEAILVVERERQQQDVLAARQRTETERKAAKAVDAEQYVGNSWDRAEQIVIKAQQYETQGEFAAATIQYEEAAQHFRRLRDEAVLQAVYQQALAAQQQMQMAKVQDTTLREWASSSWQEADALAASAEQTLRDQECEEATQAFIRATRAYQQAAEHARRERQQQENERQAAAEALFRRTESVRQAADKAYQNAKAADAETYAHSLYSRASTVYINAEVSWQQQLYEQAGEGYVQAQQIFTQATEAARDEARRRSAATVQQQMRTKRDAAVAAEAETLAASLFHQAKEVEAAAAAAFARRDWTRAEELFATAQRQYSEAEAAAQAAKQQQRQAALRAAAKLEAAQAQASAMGADPNTHPLCVQARETTRHAEALFASADYVVSAQQYERAYQHYKEAARIVEQERQRGTAVQAREQTESERATAQLLGATRWFAPTWAQLEQDIENARQAERRESFGEAIRLYQKITESFVRLQLAAREEQAREKAEAVRQQFQAVRLIPEELRQWAVEIWPHAQKCAEEAERAYKAHDYDQAASLYQEASQSFIRARQQAEREHAAQQVRMQQAEAARQSCIAVQEALLQINVPNSKYEVQAHPLFKQAQDIQQQAEDYWGARAYEQATLTYTQAQGRYEETRRAIQLEGEQTETRHAGQHALSVRAAAERVGAAQRFSSAWAEAEQSAQEAQKREEHQELREATTFYLRAAEQFGQLQHDTEQQIAQEFQELQQHVLDSYRQTEQSRRKAEQAEAPRYAQDVYETGLQQLQEGQRQRAANMWEMAGTHFVEAQTLFVQAAKLARRQKVRQAAEAARSTSQALYTEMQRSRVGAVFPEKLAEAASIFTVAERAWTREEFAVAQKNFDQAHHLLQQLHQDLIRYDQREQAEQAKAHAQSRQQEVKGVTGQHQEADREFAAAERAFQQEKYQEAQAQYEKAATLWVILLEQKRLAEAATTQVPAHTPETPVAVPPRARKKPQFLQGNTPYVLIGTALLLLFVTLYVPKWLRSSEEVAKQEPQGLSQETREQTPQASFPSERTTAAVSPLTIVSSTPEPVSEFVIKEGSQQPFSIQVTSTGQEELRYVWRLNGKEQIASGKTWVYSPGFEEGSSNVQTVEVTVSDKDNHTVSQKWQGRVQNINRPPQIKTATPHPGPLNIDAEGVQRFVIEATDPDRDDRLMFAWFLDGRKVAAERQWDFHAPASGESSQVTVEVSDEEGLKTQLAWDLVIQGSAPLALTRVLPDPAQRLTIEEGKSLQFAVAVQGGRKGARRYVWQLDGKSQRGNGEKWMYQPGFEDGGETPKTVEVIISDSANHRVQQRWQVDVRNVNRPPQIQSVTPRTKSLEMTVNTTQDFAVEASDADRDDRLTYTWLVNGQEVASEKRWQFHSPATPGSYSIAAEVADGAGTKQRQVWEVLVKAAVPLPQPPAWKLSEPQEGRLKVQAGQPYDFSVVAEVAGRKEDQDKLQYLWTVNGETQTARDGRFRFVETTRPGTYEVVAVAISPQGLKSIPKRWVVEIQPLPSPPPGPSLLSEAEVQVWLELYRRAFEEKNTNRLVQLGTHTQAQADVLAQVLRTYRSYRVALIDVNIQCEGTQATLAFKRRDTMEGETKDTDTITFGLEKRTDGRISVIRR